MRRTTSSCVFAGLTLCSFTFYGQGNRCDLNHDGKVDVADVQAAINMSLGVTPCTADIAGANVCDVVVVQRVIHASLGNPCVTSSDIRTVTLHWAPSLSPDVIGYRIYRGIARGGPYDLISSVPLSTTYTDDRATPGTTYYYVISAVDAGDHESPKSNEAPVEVKVPY